VDLDTLPSLFDVVRQNGLLTHFKHSKKLGQNFLLNPAIIQRIIEGISFNDETVVEIGPGPGGLSRAILAKNPKKFIAIEKDTTCINALEPLVQMAAGRMEIICKDALKVDLSSLIPKGQISIVANLPYNVSTVLLTNWIKQLSRIKLMRLMFQKEVASRINAKVGTKDYGRLTVLCQYTCNIRKILDLPPSAFTPPPKVFSSVIELTPKNLTPQEIELIPSLENTTQALFSKRRKMIRNSLSDILNEQQLQRVFEQVDETTRPEQLSIAQIARIARIYHGFE
jgi:16S rRNA (adenine1518-N6/adenine1519-N6)-dimethyltransferase